ncbi:YebC/PmpR family DNA-binding transcriptional regulator [bacterium]|nr:YebC/PmpR family DNA-binding transcriptional regulator [bacterium]
MAGHSKWANIKHKKARRDEKKVKIYQKLIKEITVAARLGGADVAGNPKLKLALIKAKAQSLPNKNIESSIAKGAGINNGEKFEECMYEGYGPSGTAFIIKCLTDNKTRTVADVRYIFNRNDGNMGETGSVAWGFNHQGKIVLEKTEIDEEELMTLAIDAGAEDVEVHEEVYEITTQIEDFAQVADALEKQSIAMINAEVSYFPENTVDVTPEEGEALQKMIEIFEDHEDVSDVIHNVSFPDE